MGLIEKNVVSVWMVGARPCSAISLISFSALLFLEDPEVRYAVIPQLYTIIAFGASLASILFMRALNLLIRVDSLMDGMPTYLEYPYFTLNFSLWLSTAIVWLIAFMLSLRYIRKRGLKLTEVIAQNLYVTVFAAFTVIVALCGCVGFSNTYHSVPPGTILPLLSPLTLGTRTVAYFGTLWCVPAWICIVLWEQLRPRWTPARRKTGIGLILLACSPFARFFTVRVGIGPLFDLTLQQVISRFFTSYAIRYTPISVLTIVGLVFYIVGKRELKKRSIKHPEIIFSSTVLGVVLLVFCVLYWPPVGNYTGLTFIDRLIMSSPRILSFVLWLISGIILIVDSWRDLS